MAEQKKSKVVSNEFKSDWEWQGNKMYTHLIKFENGDVGQCNFKTQNDAYFQIDKEVDYGIEKVPRKNYPLTKDWKISKPKKEFGGFGGGGSVAPKGIKEYKAEAVLIAAKIASNASLVKEGVTFDQVYPVMEKKLWDRLNEIFK